MIKKIKEGEADVLVPADEKITKKMKVFYNPLMKSNRDINVLLMNYFSHIKKVLDPLAGSGVRSLRLSLECPQIEEISANDHNPKAVEFIRRNIKTNNIKNIEFSKESANLFLQKQKVADYIDIDPFGSPNPFLDIAVRRLRVKGILGVTATDTAALTGTAEKACLRKYWAKPLKNYLMHEIALRILIRKIQLIGTQYELALNPVCSYHTRHYYRVYLQSSAGAGKSDRLLKKHSIFHYCKQCLSLENDCRHKKIEFGPLYSGRLGNERLLKQMCKACPIEWKEAKSLLEILEKETSFLGFFDVHKIAEQFRLNIPKKQRIIEELRNKEYKAENTHFSPYGIKTNAKINTVKRIIRSLA